MKKILFLFAFALLLGTAMQAQDSICPAGNTWTDTTIDGTTTFAFLPFGSYGQSDWHHYTSWTVYSYQELAAPWSCSLPAIGSCTSDVQKTANKQGIRNTVLNDPGELTSFGFRESLKSKKQ